MRELVVAVDVGTTSARAGVFNRHGRLLARSRHPILMRRDGDHIAEHDSEDIWRATCQAVKAAMAEAGAKPEQVASLGFDATCSLVLRDRDGKPLSVSATGDDRLDTIVWLDHRAVEEAERLNASRHPVLDFCGGALSPEMQLPKLAWIKRHMPRSWQKAGYFFDLADFLTWRATGSTARSRSTLTAKWNFLAHEQAGWQRDFLALAGLDDMVGRGALPQTTLPVGGLVDRLSDGAAAELCLTTGCLVTPGIIDAYAGALGALGTAIGRAGEGGDLALVGGTSSCLVALSATPIFTDSLWGPFRGALLPDLWLVEGSQSAAGALLDHVVRMHAAGGEPTPATHQRIIDRIAVLREGEPYRLGERLNILPDFHGNRAPLADPRATGTISGLTLDTSFDGLCQLYWRSCVALALGIRHILETMKTAGHAVEMLHVAGGHALNPHLVELYADVTGYPVRLPSAPDAVLLGTAMAASVAGALHADLTSAAAAMDQGGTVRLPEGRAHPHYERDYRRFLAMQRHRTELEAIR
ncbi:FGGY-family carbohydrate kinase [Rhizobium straminoryzae]|uniref:FGGY-family carbohydrate kinase n=1 Tax=Rhizobium straminoryzae TaxID=1387186 RepID=A0A549SZJ8_9HYPH|nr:FGGY-family carbohydrate kinase [Rhizobium straminoryzae]TRL34978.1 FGGY-family carbohydrate kinase [Rhizobium straminoryzae]